MSGSRRGSPNSASRRNDVSLKELESYLSFLLYIGDGGDDDRYRVTPDPGRDAREAELRDTEERLGAPDKLLSLVFEAGVRVLGTDPERVRPCMEVIDRFQLGTVTGIPSRDRR